MARDEHEVIIVGGGPAGLSLAMHLVHRQPALRTRLVVLEKYRYPREKYCAGAIGARGEMALGRIGARIDVPAAEVSGISVRVAAGHAQTRRGPIGRVVRRIEYDHALAREAQRRGVRIEEQTAVTAVETSPQGVRVSTTRGELAARVVVGADGVGSAVRRSMGLGAGRWRAQVLEVDTPPVADDPAPDLLHFDLSDHELPGYLWDFPTIVEGERLACRGIYRLSLPPHPPASELTERLAAYLAQRGLDLGACRQKRYAERGFTPHEASSAPRRLLIGEAAGIDPLTGEGIAQALLYGEAAAPYLIERLATDRLHFDDWGAALARSRVGIDLRLRHEVSARYFGPARAFFEEAFLGVEDVLPLGTDYFAGRRLDRRRQLVAGVQVLGHVVRRRALRPWQLAPG